MIKVNELRVGNWINKRGGYLYQLDLSDFYDMEGAGHGMDGASKTDTTFESVSLTPEILKACGFNNTQYISAYKKENVILLSIQHAFWWNWGYGWDIKIASLHQLQNLWFVLKGEELLYMYNP